MVALWTALWLPFGLPFGYPLDQVELVPAGEPGSLVELFQSSTSAAQRMQVLECLQRETPDTRAKLAGDGACLGALEEWVLDLLQDRMSFHVLESLLKVTETLFRVTATLLMVTRTLLQVTEILFQVTETLLQVTETLLMVTEALFQVTETLLMVSVRVKGFQSP